jgi:hypothetical protein
MNKLKMAGAVIASCLAGIANASVSYTNETEDYRLATIYQWESSSAYGGFDTWYNNGAFTVWVAPGETINYDDNWSSTGDGGNYVLIFELISIE